MAMQAGIQALQQGDLDSAAASFQAILDAEPDHAGALVNLAVVLRRQGRPAAAIPLLRQACGKDDAPAASFVNLASLLDDQGEAAQALETLRTASARFPQDGRIHLQLALLLLRPESAIAGSSIPSAEFLEAATRAAQHLPPDDPAFRQGTAVPRITQGLWDADCWEAGVTLLRNTANAQPDAVAAQQNLATALSELAHYDQALAAHKRVLALAPDSLDSMAAAASAMLNTGDAKAAFAFYEQAMEKPGSRARLGSAYMMASLYRDDRSDAEVFALHKLLAAERSAPATPLASEALALAPRHGDAPLRVGYVTADLGRMHPVAQFATPVLAAHAAAGVQQFIYFNSRRAETSGMPIADLAEIVPVHDMDDDALAQRIAADRLDLLIDLSGQTAANRLPVFALRPAPATASMIGYPHSTGSPDVDWLISDGVLFPRDEPPLATEQVARLPDSFLCFTPPPGMPSPTGKHPDGPIVFGSLNHMPKLTDSTLALWAGVVNAVPGSKLLIKCAALAEEATARSLSARFARHGLDPSRLLLEGPEIFADAMLAYERMDVAFDPIPYNGGTTTAHALWMGVPVISLAGTRACGRMGASLLAAAGCDDWLASSADDYVRIATDLAASIDSIRGERQALHRRVASSTLCDVPKYAAALLDLYRDICGNTQSQNQRPLPQPQEATMANPSEQAPSTAPSNPEQKLELNGSRQFPSWLAEQKLSLAFTTYQVGKLFLIGLQPDGRLSVFERTFNRAMGLWTDTQQLYMATLYQLWRFDNVLEPGQSHDGYDRLFVPQVAWTTGDVDVHDIALDGNGRVTFANTLFSCLATTSESHSFNPLWRPPFISRLAAEDRCHMNGLAMRDGKPAFVTAVSKSDAADGWRDRRQSGGVIIDVARNEIIADGLSMPHSPRWHDGKLWFIDSGNGYLCSLEPETGEVTRVTFLPGYGRGLAMHGKFAVVGLSKPRHNKTFSGLALDGELAKRDAEPRCGLWVVDLDSGDIVHWLRIDGVIGELYDVCALPGVQRPMAIGLVSDEIRRMIRVGPEPS